VHLGVWGVVPSWGAEESRVGRAKPPFVVRAVMEQEDIIFRFLTRQPLPLLFLEDAMVRTIAPVLFRSLFPTTHHHHHPYIRRWCVRVRGGGGA
jgi:hypothetical protein